MWAVVPEDAFRHPVGSPRDSPRLAGEWPVFLSLGGLAFFWSDELIKLEDC